MSITFNDFFFFFFFLFALLCFIFVVWCSGLYFCEISFSYFALFRTFDQKAFATWYSRTLRDFFFSGLGGEKKLKSLTRFRSRSPSLRVKSRRQSESFYKCSQGIRALCTWGKNTKNAEPRCPARRTKRFNAVWFLSSPPGSSHHILTSVVHAGPLTLTHFIPAQYEKNVTVNLFWNFASPSPFFFPPRGKVPRRVFFCMTSRWWRAGPQNDSGLFSRVSVFFFSVVAAVVVVVVVLGENIHPAGPRAVTVWC